MRTLLAAIFALVSGSAPTSQAPVMISGVAKLTTTFTLQGEAIPVYEYERVGIYGDLPLQDFRGLITASAPHLNENERIEAVIVTKYNPLDRTHISTRDSAFQVRTCQTNCTDGPDRGATGRYLIFARTTEGMRLLRVYGFIE